MGAGVSEIALSLPGWCAMALPAELFWASLEPQETPAQEDRIRIVGRLELLLVDSICFGICRLVLPVQLGLLS